MQGVFNCQLEGTVNGSVSESDYENKELPPNCVFLLEYLTIGVEELDRQSEHKYLNDCRNREKQRVSRTLKRIARYDKEIAELETKILKPLNIINK